MLLAAKYKSQTRREPILRRYDFFLGTLAPFLRASDSPMAIACLRLFTRPPLPAFPERSVPCFFRRIALFTDFSHSFPVSRHRGLLHERLVRNAIATMPLTRCVSVCKLLPESMYVQLRSVSAPFPTRCTALQTECALNKSYNGASLAVDRLDSG